MSDQSTATSIKGILLRAGAIAYMCALPLPCIERTGADGTAVRESGLAFVLQSMLPQWWIDVPLAFPVFLGNLTVLMTIALAGITFRSPHRQWWLAVPCLLAACTGLLMIQIMPPLFGFWLWLLGMTLMGLAGFLRRRDDEMMA